MTGEGFDTKKGITEGARKKMSAPMRVRNEQGRAIKNKRTSGNHGKKEWIRTNKFSLSEKVSCLF